MSNKLDFDLSPILETISLSPNHLSKLEVYISGCIPLSM